MLVPCLKICYELALIYHIFSISYIFFDVSLNFYDDVSLHYIFKSVYAVISVRIMINAKTLQLQQEILLNLIQFRLDVDGRYLLHIKINSSK